MAGLIKGLGAVRQLTQRSPSVMVTATRNRKCGALLAMALASSYFYVTKTLRAIHGNNNIAAIVCVCVRVWVHVFVKEIEL